MENNKMLEKTREALEEHLQVIIRKGANMTPPDIEILTKDICALEALKRIEIGFSDDSYSRNSFGGNSNSYARGRSSTTGRYMSRDEMPMYHDGGSSQRYYDGGSGNSGYSGHSINDRMVDKLERMMGEAQNEHEKQIVGDWINRIRNS